MREKTTGYESDGSADSPQPSWMGKQSVPDFLLDSDKILDSTFSSYDSSDNEAILNEHSLPSSSPAVYSGEEPINTFSHNNNKSIDRERKLSYSPGQSPPTVVEKIYIHSNPPTSGSEEDSPRPTEAIKPPSSTSMNGQHHNSNLSASLGSSMGISTPPSNHFSDSSDKHPLLTNVVGQEYGSNRQYYPNNNKQFICHSPRNNRPIATSKPYSLSELFTSESSEDSVLITEPQPFSTSTASSNELGDVSISINSAAIPNRSHLPTNGIQGDGVHGLGNSLLNNSHHPTRPRRSSYCAKITSCILSFFRCNTQNTRNGSIQDPETPSHNNSFR